MDLNDLAVLNEATKTLCKYCENFDEIVCENCKVTKIVRRVKNIVNDNPCEYFCKLCGGSFYCENMNDFEEWLEDELWFHLKEEHPIEFENCKELDTEEMIKELFERSNVNE